MGNTRISALMGKHWLKLNQKVEQTLGHGWVEWVAQVAELQVFQADAKNWKNEGPGFYKMDKK